MSTPSSLMLEKRIFRMGGWLILAGSLVAWLWFDRITAVSLLVGGILAALNMAWLRQTINSTLRSDPKTSKRRVLAGLFLRLLLIPLCLYVMIRFTLLGIPAIIAGFAVVNSSILIEGILEALGGRSQ